MAVVIVHPLLLGCSACSVPPRERGKERMAEFEQGQSSFSVLLPPRGFADSQQPPMRTLADCNPDTLERAEGLCTNAMQQEGVQGQELLQYAPQI
eukprot:927394-Amphidinium_carterae.1